MDYPVVKLVHQSAVALSFAGFFARGIGMIRESPWVRSRAAKTVPHLVDTVLLGSAVALVWMLGVSLFATPWLVAKIVGLVVYIVLGSVALRYGRSRGLRIGAWIAALATFGYIVSVAITKTPEGFFRMLR